MQTEEFNQNALTFVDKNGNETVCNVLFTFYSETYDKDYVIFYPQSEIGKEDIQLAAATYVETGDSVEMQEIQTDEEWEMIEEALQRFSEENEDS